MSTTKIIQVGEPPWKGINAKFKFEIFSNDEFIRPVLEKGYIFEKYLLMESIKHKNPGLILDVGANIGTFAIPLSKWGPVWAFEPNPLIFNLLENNVKINKSNVKIQQVAVGNYDGKINISLVANDGQSSGEPPSSKPFNWGGLQVAKQGIPVPIHTLDFYNFPRIGLIKIDVEGFEKQVFEGAQKTIKQWKPPIIFEQNGKSIREFNSKFNIFEFLKKCGYTTLIKIPRENIMALVKPPNIKEYINLGYSNGFQILEFVRPKY